MECYGINRSKIVYEVLNTEVIAIDFNTGSYYALAHIAKQVWQLIEKQFSLDRIVQVLSDHYKCEKDRVLVDVQQFVEQLFQEGLIELTSEQVQESADPIQWIAGWEYDAPTLQKYTDVQNLLLIDPIHEVTEVGWPDKKD